MISQRPATFSASRRPARIRSRTACWVTPRRSASARVVVTFNCFAITKPMLGPPVAGRGGGARHVHAGTVATVRPKIPLTLAELDVLIAEGARLDERRPAWAAR